MLSGAYYRTSDHISNFKLKVRLWRVSSNLPLVSSFENPDNSTQQPYAKMADAEEHVFSWQEKIFSKREIEYYEIPRDYSIPIEAKYHEDVEKLKKAPANYPKYLYSYVEADANRPNLLVNKPTTTEFVHPLLELRNNMQSQLKTHPGASRVRPFGEGEFGGTFRHRGKIVEFLPSNEFKSKRSHVLGTFQTMYIMADVTNPKHLDKQPTSHPLQPSSDPASDDKENAAITETAKEEESNKTESNSSSEVALCVIRFDPTSGLLVIKPDFNGSRDSYDVPATVHSESFQYRIIHISPQMTEQDRERDRQTLSLIDAQKANLLRASVGPDFEIPMRDVMRLVAFGEILTATDFEYDSVYIMHSWEMPQSWSLSSRCPPNGVTQRCSRMLIDDHYVAHFSSPLELDAFYQCSVDGSQNLLRFPSLLVHVASIDSWNRLRTEGYGFVDVPFQSGVHNLEIKCWRPVGRSMFDEMRRYFIGASSEIEDITYARVPSSFQGNKLSRLGFRVQSTGTVKLRLHVMLQAGEAKGQSAEMLSQLTDRPQIGFIPDGQVAARMTQRGLTGLSALSQAVQVVLDGYQKAKEKLAAAREGLPSHIRAMLMLSNEPNQRGIASAAAAVLSSRMTRQHFEKKDS